MFFVKPKWIFVGNQRIFWAAIGCHTRGLIRNRLEIFNQSETVAFAERWANDTGAFCRLK